MGTFSFKSVGKTQEQKLLEALAVTPVPIGIKTPMRPGTTDGAFAMHFSLADAIHDNLRNLLLTNFGERLCLYDFGANLRPLTAEFVSSEDFDEQATTRIKAAVGRWMNYVELEDYDSTAERTATQSLAAIVISITYNIPALGVKRKALQITLYVI